MIELKQRVSRRSDRGVAPRPERSCRRLAGALRLGPDRPAFFFDLACPFSYLAAERVQRMLGQVDWIPASSDEPWGRLEAVRAHARRRAGALRLPLVWPDRFPAPVPRALRAAAYATEVGAGDRFTLAAGRLAFCGGFDLEEPDVLAEAAAAAGLSIEACLAAADDAARGVALQATARTLLARGVTRLPAFRVGGHFLQGERAIDAAGLLRPAIAHERPLAPVC